MSTTRQAHGPLPPRWVTVHPNNPERATPAKRPPRLKE
ncbi:hypothetical protein HX92_0177 [Mycobacterium tuberculosis]|nr:hypothetical protein BCGT_2195 [Mycobacterium tuberculosis variant bovis BCG str. ATCC 35743]AIB49044.1 hypothetical protein MTBK_25000 [Mycobacterium tuberculosis K]AKR02167.1 hypothetical protein Mb1595_p2644 [Mycobacterium tuberculosis variant bovis]ALA78898.1 Uncharacterized protein BCGR_2581 [Mycobacterium tuberculosis variant bovis BCG]ALB19566.1 Hypothetical protein AFL40_2466 [Mycobacterium tuberculosis]EQM19156.1 hypothetical protein FJ05194_2938 [Mycobacterium tuberculosis FJ05194